MSGRIDMDPSMALLAVGLGAGLIEVSKTIGDLVVDPLLEPAKEQFKEWAQRHYRALEKDKKLQDAFQRALKKMGAPVEDENELVAWAKRNRLDHLQARGSAALRRQVALAVLGFCDPQANPPEGVRLALNWPISREADLANFLTALRSELASVEDWKDLIAIANAAEQQGQLRKLLGCYTQFSDLFVKSLADLVVETASGSALRVQPVRFQITREEVIRVQEAYCANIIERFSIHSIQGLDHDAGQPVHLPLEEIYFEMGLLPWRSPGKREEEEQAMLTQDVMRRMQEEKARGEKRVKDALMDYPRMVVLGKPGSGKTVTQHFLALILARGEAGAARLGLEHAFLPLLVRLGEYAQNLQNMPGASLYDFLLESFCQTCKGEVCQEEVFDRALKEGRCMILLDGLDETGDIGETIQKGESLRTRALRQIVDFSKLWCSEKSGNRMLVTSRLEGFQTNMLPGFQEVELSPLGFPAEVQEFLKGWFISYFFKLNPESTMDSCRDRGADTAQKLSREIGRSAGVSLLATNPLLLTILALIFNMGRKLPEQRVELYRVVAHSMIENWRRSQTEQPSRFVGKVLNKGEVMDVLSRLAFWLHEKKPGGSMPENDWRDQIEMLLVDEDLIDAKEKKLVNTTAQNFLEFAQLENGLLAERSPERIGFFHLTLEEYLAAFAVCRMETEERQRFLDEKWPDPYWEEVILLAAGELQTGTREALRGFVTYLLSIENDDGKLEGRPALLAGKALVDIQNRKGALNNLVIQPLRGAAQDIDPISQEPNRMVRVPVLTRVSAADTLDALGWLPNDLDEFVFIPGGKDCKAFWIGKYPVTNCQYERFLTADDFDEPELWCKFPKFDEKCNLIGVWGDEGLTWLKAAQKADDSPDGKRVEPRDWRDPRFGVAHRGVPVVGITWYEANAYCKWLFKHWKEWEHDFTVKFPNFKLQAVRLPTEAEWVAAAGGKRPEERFAWDENGKVTKDTVSIVQRANVSASNIGKTTPVWMYPLGKSENGVWDMSGNVFEWQANFYKEGSKSLALRGGSWGSYERYARMSLRRDDPPELGWYNYYGFRVVVPS
jgi:formylglycine-generating enzyme required for sulfatase activity